MADDSYQSLPLQTNVNRAAVARANEAIEFTGRALPCKVTAVAGSIVTVEFQVMGPWTLEPITIPKLEAQWMRSPTQIGDLGMTVPADTYLGGMSGLGGGIADLTIDYGNLTNLVWIPVGAKGFGAIPDQNKAWVNGPAGAVVSDTALTATMTASLNNVTHQAGVGTATQVTTIVDGAGNAISHVVSTGGKVGIGALASTLPITAAAISNANLSTALGNVDTAFLSNSSTLVTSLAAHGAFAAGFNPATFVALLVAGFFGAIPKVPGSTTVLIKP